MEVAMGGKPTGIVILDPLSPVKRAWRHFGAILVAKPKEAHCSRCSASKGVANSWQRRVEGRKPLPDRLEKFREN